MTRSTALCWLLWLLGSCLVIAMIRGITPEFQAAFQHASSDYVEEVRHRYEGKSVPLRAPSVPKRP